MLSPIGLLVGLVLLVYGRRLYWLFVAGVGFLAGLELAPRFFPDQSELVVLLLWVSESVVSCGMGSEATSFGISVTL